MLVVHAAAIAHQHTAGWRGDILADRVDAILVEHWAWMCPLVKRTAYSHYLLPCLRSAGPQVQALRRPCALYPGYAPSWVNCGRRIVGSPATWG